MRCCEPCWAVVRDWPCPLCKKPRGHYCFPTYDPSRGIAHPERIQLAHRLNELTELERAVYRTQLRRRR